MKSDFSRSLHHTLSHSDVKHQSISMLSYSGLTRISRLNKLATWFDLDHRVKPDGDKKGKDASLKPDNDSICAGRSMVEMLGVLAIIGVLSVGAIAGYSKAMMKYKLNQHAVAVNMLINNVLSIKDKLEHGGDNNAYYNQLLYKMNLLPDGIVYQRNAYNPITELSDIWFKNKIGVVWSKSKWTNSDGSQRQDNIGVIKFEFNSTADGAEVCRNIVIAAKENSADLAGLRTTNKNTDSSSQTEIIQGDKACNKYVTCLRDLDLNTISKLCNNCKSGSCSLAVTYH